MSTLFNAGTVAALAILAGCSQITNIEFVSALDPNTATERPPDALPGKCYGKITTPAIIETTTHQVLVRASKYDDSGALIKPAVYRTETVQDIVQPRTDSWFLAPCTDDLRPEFTASSQRALKARGYYPWPVTGKNDLLTRGAIKQYQATLDIDSATLSVKAAQKLGLIAYPREET